EADHLGLLGLLNSSTACFLLKQTCHNKGAGGGSRVDAGYSPLGEDVWESHFAFNGTNVGRLPLPLGRPTERARRLEELARDLAASLPDALEPTQAVLAAGHAREEAVRGDMIAAQEELDWEVYCLYDL